jgi:hypothetical protein
VPTLRQSERRRAYRLFDTKEEAQKVLLKP